MGGDLEAAGIAGLVAKHGPGAIDVDLYKVSHHGSETGAAADYADQISPKISVLSVGDPEIEYPLSAWGHGHPSRAVVELWDDEVSKKRPVRTVRAFEVRKQMPVDVKVDRAVYATAWDGDVVVEMRTTGWSRVRVGGL